MKKLSSAIGIILLTTSTAVMAEKELGLSGSGEASYTASTGNTEEDSLYSALKLNYEQKMYKLTGLLEANSKNESGNQTKERYVGDFQGDLFFANHPKAYGFGQIRYEHDRFEAIDLNSYYTAGLGYKIIEDDVITLGAELGAGHQKEDYSNKVTTKDFSQTIIKAAATFTYQINENVEFAQDLTSFIGEEQTKTESNTSLNVSMSDALKLKATYKIRDNSNPATGKENTDTETYFGIVYDF